MIGQKLGPYEILAKVGEGGMGEVYRARDTNLGREVAIKVLPETFHTDPSRLARFEREAQLLASVNHPNIATLYGMQQGTADGAHVRALVMEFVPGATLADHLRTVPRGRGLPLEETLRIARQLADALEAAHERGIVHRDLKPANIKIRPDGTVKVLDFGIAKAEQAQLAGSGTDTTETMAVSATREGVILGSPGYMSPEQARGLAVDARADIWAFGCVLFEMVSGHPPFSGDTAFDIIAATLNREPEWASLPGELPEPLHRLLHRCLQREPRRRLRSIADAMFDLEDTLHAQAAIGRARHVTAATQTVRFQRLTDRLGLNESPAISPDGRMVAFVAVVAGERHIWVRLLAGGAPLQLTHGTGRHEQPRWTPDGSAIIYLAGAEASGESGTLMEISALGGPSRPLASSLNGGDVSHDGRYIATFQSRDDVTDLVIVSREDGRVVPICSGPRGVVCRLPRWSPDDRTIAFNARTVAQFDERLYIVRAAAGEQPETIARAAALRGHAWLPDGSGLVYGSSLGSALPYPSTFNLRRVTRDGKDDQALTFGDWSYLEPDVHPSGRVLAARIRMQSDLWRFPVGGSAIENTRAAVRITRQSGQVQTPSVSPDGSEVVYLSDNGGHANLWVCRTDGTGVARQITFEADPAVTVGLPLWSPVDNRIMFVQNRGGIAMWMIHADGRGLRRLVPTGLGPCWSPDGAWVFYSVLTDTGGMNLHKVSVDGEQAVLVRGDRNSHAPAVGTSAMYFAARVSSSIAIEDWEIRRASPEDGPSEVLTRVAGSRLPVSPLFPHTVLSRDGRLLAMPLMEGDTSTIGIMSVTGGSFRPVIDFGDRPMVIARQVSWAPDGSIYAAVAEINEDIVLLDGLI